MITTASAPQSDGAQRFESSDLSQASEASQASEGSEGSEGSWSPTVWGLTPEQLHERFWASRGVQVVRVGRRAQLVRDAELYLLTDVHLHTIFRLTRPIEILTWSRPRLLTIRLHDSHQVGYREHVLTDEDGQFIQFQRVYHGKDSRLGRVALTSDRQIAHRWQSEPDAREAWRALRREIEPRWRTTISLEGGIYDQTDPHEEMRFMRELVQVWSRPDTTVPRLRRLQPRRDANETAAHRNEAWIDGQADVHPATRFVGPAWVGAGRSLDSADSVVGPAILWDQPRDRPDPTDLRWREIEPTSEPLNRSVKTRRPGSFYLVTKRAFDLVMASILLAATVPFYPLIMLAIWLEDGRPFFFVHRRETRGPREFPCFKFRSMRNDAEQIKEQIKDRNMADGPQFFIERDPRLTRVGRLLRKTQIDEWPQFVNIILGHMSFVGPRPSPYKENQYCPPWREARLSVRPGLTGLWQIKRTRQPELDFQEWIKFDSEYVENACWTLDLEIMVQTALMVIGLTRSK